MPNVEFVYEQTCPFVSDARRRLIEGFRHAGMMPRWSEWEVSDPRAPEHLRCLGSPTILVDGKDVAGTSPDEAVNCCRIYSLNDGPSGVPSLEMIVAALTSSVDPTDETLARTGLNVRFHASLLPAIGLAALPKLTCPACWPAYAGLLSSLGIGFVNYTPYLLPLTAVFLSISVISMAYRAPRRHGYGPFMLGVLAALAILVGKFVYDSDGAMWIGLAVLVVASIWNSWPRQQVRKSATDSACAACT